MGEKQELRNEIENLHEANAGLREELVDWQTGYRELVKLLQKRGTEIQRYETELEDAKRAYRELVEQGKTDHARATRLQAENDNQRNRIAELEDEEKHLERVIRAEQDEADRLMRGNDALRVTLAELREENARLEDGLAEVRDQYYQQTEKGRILAKNRDYWHGEADRLGLELTELREKWQQARESEALLRDYVPREAASRREYELLDWVDELKGELLELSEDHAKLGEYASAAMATLAEERRYGPAEGAPGTEKIESFVEDGWRVVSYPPREAPKPTVVYGEDSVQQEMDRVADRLQVHATDSGKPVGTEATSWTPNHALESSAYWRKYRIRRQLTHHMREMRRIHG